jgi:hypothetical protein
MRRRRKALAGAESFTFLGFSAAGNFGKFLRGR